MTNNIVMLKVNVFEAKAKFSEYLERAGRGERIVICRHNKPIAELCAINEARAEPRPIGPIAGRPTFDVPATFFEPMSGDDLELWERNPVAAPAAETPPARRGSRVAEGKTSYRASRTRGSRRRS
jgi:prevent-host-death family protein